MDYDKIINEVMDIEGPSACNKYASELEELQKNGYVDEILSYSDYKIPSVRYRIINHNGMFPRRQ